MSRHIIENFAFLKALYYAEPLQRKLMIDLITIKKVQAFSEIASFLLQGRISLPNIHKHKLKDYWLTVRSLAKARISVGRKKRTLHTFHYLLPLLIKPVLSILDEQMEALHNEFAFLQRSSEVYLFILKTKTIILKELKVLYENSPHIIENWKFSILQDHLKPLFY